jgi:diguanylate cyclase (GGDEF)-like protein
MQAALRAGDFLARFGGDEFLVMLQGVDTREAAEAVLKMLEEKLTEVVSLESDSGAIQAYTGAAIGLALYPPDGKDVDTLIKNADAAMYLRKQSASAKNA